MAGSSVPGRDVPQFREQVISTGAKMGYQLVAADLNGDGRPDIACVGASTGDLKLYVNLGR